MAKRVAIIFAVVAAATAAPPVVVVAAVAAAARAARRHHMMVAVHDEGLEELLSHPWSRPEIARKSHSTKRICDLLLNL